MANQANECFELEINDHYSTTKEGLSELMELQKSIQENVYKCDFTAMQSNLKELKEFWDMNYHAIQDELREAFDALGGIHDGVGSGVWKRWKKSHAQVPNMKLSDLSERDMIELKFELIDIQHFLFNMMLSIGMTPQEVFNMYISKNKENIERQNRPGGY